MKKLTILVGLAMVALVVIMAVGVAAGPAGLRPEPQSAEAALLSEVRKLLASDAQFGDFFGGSVAVSGDTAVVGAYLEDAGAGAAYVFQRDKGGAGNWDQVTKLIASDAQAGDWFGFSVAVSGDTAVVGAIHEDAGGFWAGAAYVFQRDQGGADNWGQVKKLTASDAQAFDSLGISVAVSGDTAVVGAFGEDAGGEEAGAAYVFGRDEGGAGNWGEVTKLTASDAQAGDGLGFRVAVSGDAAVVGAPYRFAGGSFAGAAYVFKRDQGGADNWGEVTKLTVSGAEAIGFFGSSVAVSGDTVVVGAYPQDGEPGLGDGAAYVFQRDEGGADNWGQVTKLTAPDAQVGDLFGQSVALSGDTAVVGAYEKDAAGPYSGAAYVFQRDQGGADNWAEVTKLTASGAQAGDGFGFSVALSGDTAVVGAPFEDAGGSDAGAAYVFEEPAPTPTPTPTNTPTPKPTPTPKNPSADTDGDTIPNGTDPDDDNDGCSDAQELGTEERLGGRRNPHNFWDFFDPTRDGAVAFGDFLLLVQHFNTNDAGGTAPINRNSDPLTTPDPGPGSYHPLVDRGAVVGKNPWNVGPPDGAIGFGDFLALVSQFGHTCA